MGINKLSRRARTGRSVLATSLFASTMLAGGAAFADAPAAPENVATVPEVIVTAEKRSENIQKVSMSIQALDSKSLEQRNVNEFQDYVKFLPSVSFQSTAPSSTSVYMRGVASGENGNHSGPLPSVGMYLDEQPITTIAGALDIHIYDIERVESLAGPQGTLYGASSESGTIRIITNKPSTKGFAAGYDLQANNVKNGAAGYVAEGYINQPLSDKAAIRLVGWAEHDSGYIDNVAGTRTFPTSGGVLHNAAYVKKHFNDVDTYGARAALKVDLNENWTLLPQVVAQDQQQHGVFGYEPGVGDLKVQHFSPDTAKDKWYQASLTVTGKVSKYDLTYSGGYFQRHLDTQSDYTDYSYWYDKVFGSGSYWTDNSTATLATPIQKITGRDRFDKQSHELRLASPSTDRLRFVVGGFIQRQSHWIIQDYVIDKFADALSVPGWKNTIWLTDQMRVDRDKALFGQATYDLTDHLSITGGIRWYDYKNSLTGFYGFSVPYDTLIGSGTGAASCFSTATPRGAPCVNLDKTVQSGGNTHKIDLTYKFDDQKRVYFTYATGFRPGGVNRNGNLGPYQADKLSSYEIGWKTSLFDRRVRFNGAVYYEQWNKFQYSFLGQSSLTVIQNAGSADIKGVEADVAWAPISGLTITGSGAYDDGKLTQNVCKSVAIACTDGSNGNPIVAPKNQQLPVTAKLKGNLTARYAFPLGDWDAHVQGSLVYQDATWADLRTTERKIVGQMPSYSLTDLSAGAAKGNLTVELFVKNLFDERANLTRYTECTIAIPAGKPNAGTPICGAAPYIVPQTPRLFGIKFGQKF